MTASLVPLGSLPRLSQARRMPASRVILIVALAALAEPAAAGEVEPASLPDPIMTPGASDPAATVEIVCNRTTRERRSVSAATKAAVLAAYNIPASQSAYYEIDHLVPLAIGGANTVANLWPQPWVEADEKDVLEVELQRRVCHGLVSQAQAALDVAEDWVAAYRHYILGAPVAHAETNAPPPAWLRDPIRRWHYFAMTRGLPAFRFSASSFESLQMFAGIVLGAYLKSLS